MHSSTHGSEPSSLNTIFIQADPSNFRAIVQKLTGASSDIPTRKLKLTLQTRATTEKITHKRRAFKLHERRRNTKKLELDLNTRRTTYSTCTGASAMPREKIVKEMPIVSPVSTLEFLARGSPKTPEENQKWVDEKGFGFHFHPSPITTPRGSDSPEILPLFPVRSPRDDHTNNFNNSSASTCFS